MAENGRHVRTAILLVEAVGQEARRTDRSGTVSLHWDKVCARLSCPGSGLAGQPLVRIVLTGGGREVPFEGSSERELVKSAARSIRKRIARAELQVARAAARKGKHASLRQEIINEWPRFGEAPDPGSCTRLGALVLSIQDDGTVNLKLDQITGLSPTAAGSLGRQIHEALVVVLGERSANLSRKADSDDEEDEAYDDDR